MSEDEPTSEEKKDEELDPTEELLDRLPESVTTMWEIPQIYEFLCLAKSSLHIQHLSMYEMERMLLIPRASKQLAAIMTCLLSPSLPRSKLKKVPLMPYEFWTNYLLAHKVSQWYKVYQTKEYDSVKVFDTIGVEPEFWEIFPEVASMGVRDFEDFSLRQRVWLLKTVCDTLTHSRKSLQEEVSNRYLNGESEKLLGRDRYGTRYIYFPIFLDNDLRIYKHCMNNKVFLNAVPVKAKLKLQTSRVRKKRRGRRRTNRWRNGLLPIKRPGTVKKNASDLENSTNNKLIEKNDNKININIHNDRNEIDESNVELKVDINKDEDESKEERVKAIKSLEPANLEEEEKEQENEEEGEKEDESKEEGEEKEKKEEEERKEDKEEEENEPQVKLEETSENDVMTKIDEKPPEGDEHNECTVRDDVSSSSKTDDEKINEMLSSNVNISKENNCSGSKSDDEKLIETQTQVVSDNQIDNEVIEAATDTDHPKDENDETVEHKADDDKKDSNEELDDSKLLEENLCHGAIEDENKMERTETCKRDMENFNNILTDLKGSKFQLVADSLDSLRNLIADLNALNSAKSTQPVRCEMLLINKLQVLLDTLKLKELILKESAAESKAKLLSEQKIFIEGLPELEDSLTGTRSSNAWVLGSQGCPLLSYSDTILQRLLQEDDGERYKMKIKEETDRDESDPDTKAEPETRRVLRARGVSSYIEPFSSDSESASSSYEDWVGFESVDPATGIHSAPAPLPVPAKVRLTSDQSDATDSDKEWILPSSRKRKRKGSSPSKRLRSQSGKVQTTKADCKEPETTQESVDPVPDPVSAAPDPDPIISNNGILNSIKIESVHSVLDIKDEGPIMDSQSEPVSTGMHQNYLLVNAGNGPVNYVVMPPENPSLVPQSPMISVIPQVPMHSGYYMHNPSGYLIPNQPMSNHIHSYGEPSNLQMNQHMIIQQNTNYIPPHNNYMPYHQMRAPSMYSNRYQGPMMNQPGMNQPRVNQPGMNQLGMNQHGMNQPGMNQPKVNQPVTVAMERSLPRIVQNRPVILPPRPRHPDGAVIRSTVPFRPNYRPVAAPTLRARLTAPRNPNQQQNIRPSQPRPILQKTNQPKAKTTSLIVLSDSDDDIEMIITEKPSTMTSPQKQGPKNNTVQKKVINRTNNSNNSAGAPKTTPATNKSGLTPQIIERMNQGGISITPVKPKSPAQSSPISATQLVVVFNETGSHYALALPNGSKLILTPEQVAQIRASNGGKLIL